MEYAGLIPHFNRVRTVTIEYFSNHRYLHCSCGRFQQYGIPCSHQICILSFLSGTHIEKLYEVSQMDCRVIHWSGYEKYSCNDSVTLSRVYQSLLMNDVLGPRIPDNAASKGLLTSNQVDPPKEFRICDVSHMCKNYTHEEIQAALQYNNQTFGGIQEVRMTQESAEFSNAENEPQDFPINFPHVYEEPKSIKDTSAYVQCFPIFKEVINLIEHNDDQVQKFKSLMLNFMSEVPTRMSMSEAQRKERENAMFVSCLPRNDHRTHGTKYGSWSKK